MATYLVATGVRFPDDTIRTSAREIIQVIGTNTTAVAFRTYVLTASLTLTLPSSEHDTGCKLCTVTACLRRCNTRLGF
jgi:hypothetical protein